MLVGVVCLVIVCLFVGLPVLSLLLSPAGGPLDGTALFDSYIYRVARFTLVQAFASTLLSIVFAIPVARAMARQSRFPGRIWLMRLMALPLGLPALVAALGLVEIWGRQGWVNGLWTSVTGAAPISIYGLTGILLAHVFFNMPLAARLMLAGLERLPNEYWRLSANLGMGPVAVFRFVEWPALVRLIPGIASLIFMLCATSFTLVLTLGGGPAATTIEVAIYQSLRFDFDPTRAVALSCLQIAFTAALLWIAARFDVAEDDSRTSGQRVCRFDGRSFGARLRDATTLLVFLVFTAAPLVAVVRSGLAADLGRLASDPQVHKALLTSLSIAGAAGVLTVVLAASLVRARQQALSRRRAGPSALALASGISASTSLVLLVPPVVLGSGWFLLVRPLGDVAAFAPYLIIAVNVLMALPFVVRVLDPALAQHRSRTARLADSLGLSGWSRIRLIDWPVLKLPFLMAFSFAMALSLGDLGAVALFGSQDMVTLPWLLFSRMGSYRTADAAGLALLLGLICVGLTILGTMRGRAPLEPHHG